MPDSEYGDALLFDPVSRSMEEIDTGVDDLSPAEIGLLEEFRSFLWPMRPSYPRPSEPFIDDHGHYRALHFNKLHLQSEMDLRDPLRLTLDYTRVMMGFLFFCSTPRRIEMIGLGGGSLAKYCAHTLPGADITVVEISPEVIGLRDRFLIPPDSKRFRVIQGDGADFVRSDRARPDIILVDGFDVFGQPPQLCSREFYADCYRRLLPHGIMVVNLSGSYRDRCRCAARIDDTFYRNTLAIPTEDGTNQAVFAGKAIKPTLSRTGLNKTMSAMGTQHGPFLGSLGRRILRCVDNLSQ